MSILAPRDNPDLVGHAVAEAALTEALRGGRVHHAWLLTGPAGIGKTTLVFRFARRLLAGGQGGLAMDPADPVFRRVAAGSHADLMTVARTMDGKRLRSEIRVDDVRVLQGFLRLTPAEGGWRVVVVDEAERLNRNAANALLKLLEEPPPRAVILLSCNAPGRLPVTLRSRCRLLRLSPLGLPDMQAVLRRLLPAMPEDDRSRVAALADGSPGRAIALAEDDGLALAALADSVLRATPEAVSRHAFPVADRLARADAPFGAFMDQLCGALDRAMRAHARGLSPAGLWVSRRPLSEWAEVWHALMHLRDETERLHLDRRQTILDGFALLDGQ